MTVETTVQAQPAANGTATPAVPPAPPPVAATPAPIGITSEQLKERLEETRSTERARFLKELGFEKLDDAKAAVGKLREAEKAQMSEAERARARIAELEPVAKERDALRAVVAEKAAAELAGLTEQQRAAVVGISGEDPAAQLRAVIALRPTWVVPAPAAQAPAPKPPVASTTAAAPAPTGASAPPSPDITAQYAALQKTNPMKAASFANQHRTEIDFNKLGNG